MNDAPLNSSRRGLYAVYVTAAVNVCVLAVGLHLWVPEDFAGYVSNGFTLPAFRYGLLASLIALGVVLSGEHRPTMLVAHLAIFISTLGFGLRQAESVVVSYEPLAELVVNYPVISTIMGMATGSALLLPRRGRRWLVPFVSAICGVGLGLFVVVEGPLDYYYGWFTSAGGLSGTAIVVVTTALANGVRRMCTGVWLAIAGRIFGSWLIAASLLLAALAVVAKRPLDPGSVPTGIPDGTGLSQPQ